MQVLFLLLSLFVLVFFMFFVLVFALLVKLNFYCYYFLYVRRLYFLYLLSLRQEFGKKILRGAAFLLEQCALIVSKWCVLLLRRKALCGDALL